MDCLGDERWLRVGPLDANPSLVLPLAVERGAIRFDFNGPHLVGLSRVPGNGGQGYCHVYLCGTGCNPTEHNTASHWLDCSTESEGIHSCVGLSYVWGNMTDSERNSKALQVAEEERRDVQDILEIYHNDILFGGNSSGLVDISFDNCVTSRLLFLLVHLANSRPSTENWIRFLKYSKPEYFIENSNEDCVRVSDWELNYSRFIFSGHSQGSGHVCYLAKKFALRRAILISGPQEFITTTSESISNTSNINITSSSRIDETTVRHSLPEFNRRQNSWLNRDSGNYKTFDMFSFMHEGEENTADLIRMNWSHISPLLLNFTNDMDVLRITDHGIVDWQDMSQISHPLDSANIHCRMFLSCVPPFNPPLRFIEGKVRSLRPCHNSTIADEYTPRFCTTRHDNSNNISNSDVDVVNALETSLPNEINDLGKPLYSYCLWKQFFEML